MIKGLIALNVKINVKGKALLLTALVTSSSVYAAPKQLVCSTTAESEIARLTELKLQNNYTSLDEVIEGCKGADIGLQSIFIFDTDILNGSEKANVEVIERTRCGKAEKRYSGSVSSTPITISFDYIGIPNQQFNVDRSTLKGGRLTDRNSSCKLQDMDSSKNLI